MTLKINTTVALAIIGLLAVYILYLMKLNIDTNVALGIITCYTGILTYLESKRRNNRP